MAKMKRNPTGLFFPHRLFSDVRARVTFYQEKTNDITFIHFTRENESNGQKTQSCWTEDRFIRTFGDNSTESWW